MKRKKKSTMEKTIAISVVLLTCLAAAAELSEAEVDRLCPPRAETAAEFKAGTYPPAARPYREAALKAFAYMASLPAMRTLVEKGEPELLAKARTLGDTITRVQTPEGRIPTFWTHDTLGQPIYDWLNCMGSSAAALLELDDATNAKGKSNR